MIVGARTTMRFHTEKIGDGSLVIKGNSIAYGGSEIKKYAIDKLGRH